MHRPSRKQFWLWAASVLLLVAIVASLPPVRVQYHKWRLQSAKDRKVHLLARNLSALDKFWLFMGTPISGRELDTAVTRHEDALVRLGFLVQEKLPADMVLACPQTQRSLEALQNDCPWYDSAVLSGTNLVITACPKMLARWHKHAAELGWFGPKS